MALFGRKMSALRRPVDASPIDYQMNVQLDPQAQVNPVMGSGVAAPVSKWQSFKDNAPRYLDVIGATLQDVGGSLNGNYRNALGQRTAMQERDALKQQQNSVYDTLLSDFEKNPMQAIINAQRSNIPIDSLVDMVKAGQPKTINTQYGAYTVYPDGRTEPIGADPLAEQRKQLLEAQIAAAKAQAYQRENTGDYYDARARQPYAPPRTSGGRGGRGGSGKGTNQEPPE